MTRLTDAPGIKILRGAYLGETAKAAKFQFMLDSQRHTCWFPFSQIKNIFRSPDPDTEDEIAITTWIWERKQEELASGSQAKPAPASTKNYPEDDDYEPFDTYPAF